MAATDLAEQNAISISQMLRDMYDLKPIDTQARHEGFSKYITRSAKLNGGRLHRKFMAKVFTRVGVNANPEAAFTPPGTIAGLDVYINDNFTTDMAGTPSSDPITSTGTDLRRLDAELKTTYTAMEKTEGEQAMVDVATELKGQADDAFNEKRNKLLYGTSTAVLGTVAAQYASGFAVGDDGTTAAPTFTESNLGGTYNSGDNSCFLQITDHSIANYKRGQKLTINSVNVEVVGVYYTKIIGNAKNVGPGIIVWLCGTEASGESSLDTLTAGQSITELGDSYGYGISIGDLLKAYTGSAMPYFSVANRRDPRYNFLQPLTMDYSSGSVAVSLDADRVLGVMNTQMSPLFGTAKALRSTKPFDQGKAIFALCQPSLMASFAKQIGEAGKRFNTEAFSTVDAAKAAKMVAFGGWTGVVYRNIGFPDLPIIFQADLLAPPNTVRFIDPDAWEWIRATGGTPEWLRGDMGIWKEMQYLADGNARRSPTLVAAAYVREAPFCECPQMSLYGVSGVKSDLNY